MGSERGIIVDINDLWQNHMLMSALLSWASAQVIKTIIYWGVHKEFNVKRLMGDGGMPSGHSATVTALATTAAIEYGLRSPVFALATVLAVVVMHDAMGVRKEAEKHAMALNQLFELMDADISPEVKMKEFLGHTPMQVFFGGLLGLIVAILFSLF